MEMEERWEQNSSLKTLICCFLTKCFSICAQLQLLKEKKKRVKKKGTTPVKTYCWIWNLTCSLVSFFIPIKELYISSLCINSIKCLISKQVGKEKQDCDSVWSRGSGELL